MKAPALLRIRLSRRAATIPDMVIGAAIAAVISGAMLTGLVALQRSAAAAQHHAKSQVEQTRLLSYVARDLRRALTASVDTFEGVERLNLTIPDFYDATGRPRDPVIVNNAVIYGSASSPVRVSYYKSGATMFRSVNGAATALATNVQDFMPDYTDSGEQSVGVSLSFVPKFKFNSASDGALRSGTATYATTLLRNKRNSLTP